MPEGHQIIVALFCFFIFFVPYRPCSTDVVGIHKSHRVELCIDFMMDF